MVVRGAAEGGKAGDMGDMDSEGCAWPSGGIVGYRNSESRWVDTCMDPFMGTAVFGVGGIPGPATLPMNQDCAHRVSE